MNWSKFLFTIISLEYKAKIHLKFRHFTTHVDIVTCAKGILNFFFKKLENPFIVDILFIFFEKIYCMYSVFFYFAKKIYKSFKKNVSNHAEYWMFPVQQYMFGIKTHKKIVVIGWYTQLNSERYFNALQKIHWMKIWKISSFHNFWYKVKWLINVYVISWRNISYIQINKIPQLVIFTNSQISCLWKFFYSKHVYNNNPNTQNLNNIVFCVVPLKSP